MMLPNYSSTLNLLLSNHRLTKPSGDTTPLTGVPLRPPARAAVYRPENGFAVSPPKAKGFGFHNLIH